MQSVIENFKPNQHKRQELIAPPPLHASKRKAPENCYASFIDQIQDGFYHASKLVKNSPQTNRDIYFTIRTRKTSVGSFRRNRSHKSVAFYRTKKDGSTRGNIEYLTCSFVELDGSSDNTIKTQGDVQVLIEKNNLPTASYVIETSRGHFHVIWNYSNPLPWKPKNESYWMSQQTRLIKLFQKAGFNVDKGASLNPTQNLRNPSQLNAFSFKRRCSVFIHKSYKKTSLRRIFRALNSTDIPNPAPIRAGVKLRRYSRANRTFTGTHKELAITLGVSPRTSKREIKKAIANGDIKIIARTGNNSEKTRTTQYESLIFIDPFPEVPLVRSNINSFNTEDLLRDFKQSGTRVGLRQKTIFALGLFLKHELGKQACIESVRAELEGGAMACHFPRREFEKTLRNIFKPVYTNPFSLPKMREWGLIEDRKITEIYLN